MVIDFYGNMMLHRNPAVIPASEWVGRKVRWKNRMNEPWHPAWCTKVFVPTIDMNRNLRFRNIVLMTAGQSQVLFFYTRLVLPRNVLVEIS